MATDKIERLREHTVALRALVLGFLFEWLGSEGFENPACDEDLKRCPEMKRFYSDDWHDQETRQRRRLVIDWLKEAGLIRFQESGRAGRRRQKDRSREEWVRVNRAVNGWWTGLHEERALKRCRTVLDEHKSSQRPRLYLFTGLPRFDEHRSGIRVSERTCSDELLLVVNRAQLAEC